MDIEKIVKHHYPSKKLPKWVNKELFYKEKEAQLKKGIVLWKKEIEEDEDADLVSLIDLEFLVPFQSVELDLRRDCVMDIIDETIIVPKSLVEKKAKKGSVKTKKTKVAKVPADESSDSDSESEEPPKAKKVVKSKKNVAKTKAPVKMSQKFTSVCFTIIEEVETQNDAPKVENYNLAELKKFAEKHGIQNLDEQVFDFVNSKGKYAEDEDSEMQKERAPTPADYAHYLQIELDNIKVTVSKAKAPAKTKIVKKNQRLPKRRPK